MLGLVEIPNFETLAVFRYFVLILTSYWPGPVENCSEEFKGLLVEVGNLMSFEVFSTGTAYITSEENWALCHRNLSSFGNFSALKWTGPYLVTVFPSFLPEFPGDDFDEGTIILLWSENLLWSEKCYRWVWGRYCRLETRLGQEAWRWNNPLPTAVTIP